MSTGSLELAHARMLARWGERPGDVLWGRIEATRELRGVLDLAHGCSLARWLAGLDAGAGVHRTERRLRQRWQAAVDELAQWMPEDWQPAVRRCAVLPLLPLLQHLARGGALPAWAGDDPSLRWLLEPPRSDAQHGAPHAGPDALPAALVESVRRDPAAALPAWQAWWLDAMPPGRARQDVAETLLPLVREHLARFAAADADEGWALRAQLGRQLQALMRRHAMQPLAAFAWLGLRALELERLRGELVTRAAWTRLAKTDAVEAPGSSPGPGAKGADRPGGLPQGGRSSGRTGPPAGAMP